jgi:protein gp37
MSDLFHEDVPDEFILQVWVTMAMCQEHTFQFLTKRPERMRDVLSRQFLPDTLKTVLGPGARILAKGFWPLPNVWLGTSVENQRQADRRIPQLLQTPAAVRWLSMEPLLGPVDLRNWLGCSGVGPNGYFVAGQGLDWQVIGGESGPKARRMDSEWALSLIQQGRAAGVPTFFKQPGTVLSREWGLRGKGGGDFESFPPEFRVREYPAERVGA